VPACVLLVCPLLACGDAAPLPPTPAPAPPSGPGVARRPAPEIRAVAHFDVRHGHLVDDPYRWLEGAPPLAESARVTIEAQARYARRTLGAIHGRDAWRAALERLDRAGTRIAVEGVAGTADLPRFFLSELPPERTTFALFVRDGADGRDRLLLDPARLDEPGHHHSFSSMVPSPDGARVAYAIQDNGNEHGAIEFVDADTGVALDDRVAVHGSFAWRGDGRAIFYGWGKAVFQHVLGTAQTADHRVFPGPGPATASPWPDVAVYAFPGSPWDVAIAGDGVSRGSHVFVARAAEVAAARARWREIAGEADAAVEVLARGDDVFVLTGGDAATRRIVRLDARTGTMATAAPFVPAGPDTIEAISAADDGLYLAVHRGGGFQMARVGWDGGAPALIPQAPGTSIAWFQTRSGAPTIVETDAWTHAPTWSELHADGEQFALPIAPPDRAPALARATPPPSSPPSPPVVLQEIATSADGTPIPITILRPAQVRPDAPAFVEGYGSYGVSAEPSYDRAVMAWVAAGGVWAYCDTRGGGGWLTPWHLAGIKQHKEDAVDDFVACARYLIDQHLTSAARLTAYSYSSGGVLIGGAITKHPELFAAAVLRSPIGDLTRARAMATGRYNVSEYGDADDAADFRALLASDPYHRVHDGVAYPGVLFTVGASDPRVANWQAAKLAARLAHATRTHRAVLLRVDREAGHNGGARDQDEAEWADIFAFAEWQAGVAEIR
jgi:prolyl oligopeptidase